MEKAKQSTGGSAISVVAYQGDYVNACEELQVIDATARAKKCKMPGDWQSDSVIRGATVAALDLGRVLINAQMSGLGAKLNSCAPDMRGCFCCDARLRPAILGIVLGVIEMQRREFIGLLGCAAASPFALAARKGGLGEEPCARSVLFCSVSR